MRPDPHFVCVSGRLARSSGIWNERTDTFEGEKDSEKGTRQKPNRTEAYRQEGPEPTYRYVDDPPDQHHFHRAGCEQEEEHVQDGKEPGVEPPV